MYGEQLFFCCFELSNKILHVKEIIYGPILSTCRTRSNHRKHESTKQSSQTINKVLYNNIWGINKVLLLLIQNEHGDLSFLIQNLSFCNYK